MRRCEVEGCTDEHHALGKCVRHYHWAAEAKPEEVAS